MFGKLSFETIQAFVYPLVKALGGPDIEDVVEKKADVLLETADLLEQLSTLMAYAGQSLADGLLSGEELEQIITQAEAMPDAIVAISSAWSDED